MDRDKCPIDLQFALWMENAFMWLVKQFGEDNIRIKPMVFPNPEHFPIRYDGSLDSLTKTADIVAKQMEINSNDILLDLYNEHIHEVRGDFGFRMYTQVDKESDERLSSGQYLGKNSHGKYEVFIERRNLQHPESLVATIAHEFAHIKLLGENRLEKNDEPATDLCTVVFGLGIFNANSAFTEFRTFDSWGHRSLGYLKQREWGYALALYAFFRNEDDPGWSKYLGRNLRSDLKKSLAYLYANSNKIFNEPYGGN